MLTAHRELGPRPGVYGRGWVIIDEVDGELVEVAKVATKREALAIVRAQNWAKGSGIPEAADD